VAAGGAAVVVADHHAVEALRTCTRALLLIEGTVVESAPAAEFAERPLVRARYLGRDS
jgi:ABC-type lipopolysaccharide export system ATPase subunit